MKTLQVLHVGESADDVLLAGSELRRGGLDAVVVHVRTAAELEAALFESWDLILADYSLSAFGAPQVLELLHDTGRDIPLIVVSGTIDEESAVTALRAGARDFVTWNRIARLVPAVERALRDGAPEERRIVESRLRFQAGLLDTVGEAVIATDAAGLITYWNRAAEQLYGWTAAEVYLRPVVDVTPGEAMHVAAGEILQALNEGRTWAGEFAVRRKDGSEFIASVTNTPLRDDSGALVGVVGISSDLTGRRKLEGELRQAQKMEAVGRLAGGVAHDFNNILTSISGCSQFLLDGLDDDNPLRSDALEIQLAAQRASRLTRQLLAFSRKQVVEPRVVDFGAVLAGLEAMLRRLIGEDMNVSVACEPGVGSVFADEGLLEQVVMNLVVNAADALPGGGSIAVELHNADVGPQQAADLGMAAGHCVRLTVSDSGCGIPPDVLPHIFEPFFTTKPQGKGTGLGLSTVHGIVTQAEGAVTVDSDGASGTVVRVYLPRVAGAAAAPTVNEPAAPGARGETVLLVEDDTAVRRIARRSLERGGYRVLEAALPSEALFSVIPGHTGTIDMLLTDVILPEMHGPLLAKEVLQRLPGVRVLLMSGYLPEAMRDKVEESLMDPDTRVLAKPFTLDSLLSAVRETLDGTDEAEHSAAHRGV